MANTVDERIVEARFDSSDFEKGVDKTIKKLNELKESLNLKDSGKSIAEFADDTSKGIEKTSSALERLSERFTTFKGMLKQQILGGLANEISSAFLKIEQSITGFVRSISTDQIGAGMTKYTEILNSVRTMTAAGVAEDLAYDKIKRLAEYSDQTSYSLSQMTSGMSKLVAAGMDVDKAEKSMEGLANMAASAGVNIYDAQRAFLNFSQAYGSGMMRIQDWTSFENLNMATEPVMRIFMQAAEQVGTLTRAVDKNGKEIYKTTNKINKKVKANKEVATSGFRDTLGYGWLDKATMEQATAVLSYFEDLGVDLNKLSKSQLDDFATKAFQAAKEARSFADVMGTLKDVVATGWATTFELIFGKLDKATEFFTWLTESNLAELIYSVGEFRNTVLKAWGEAYEGFDENNELIGGLFQEGFTGRDSLLAALKNIDELIGSIREGLEGILPDRLISKWGKSIGFAETLGLKLGNMSWHFRQATERLLDFFTTEEKVGDETKRVLKPEYLRVLQSIGTIIGNISSGVSAVLGVIGKIAGVVGKGLAKLMVTFQPVFDAIGNAINKLLAPIVDLNNNDSFFQKITEAIDNLLIAVEPLMGPLSSLIELLGEIGGLFISLGIDTITMNIELFADALGFIIELFGGKSAQKANEGVGVIEGWANEIKIFGESCKQGLNAIKEFFGFLFSDLKTLFGIGEKTEGNEGGFFEGITNFFKNNEFIQKAKSWVTQAVTDVQTFIQNIPKKIQKLGSVVSTFWNSLMYKETTVVTGPGQTKKIRVATPLKKWLDQAIKDAKAFAKSIPGKLMKIPSIIGEFIHGLMYEKKVDEKTGKETEVLTALGAWINQAITDVRTFIASIPGRIAALPSMLGEFIHSLLYEKKMDEKTGKETEVPTELGKWYEQAKKDAIAFIKDIPNKIRAIPSMLSEFIHGLLYTTKYADENGHELKEPTEVPTALGRWIERAKKEALDFINDIPNKVLAIPSMLSKFIHSLLYTTRYADENGHELKEPTEVPTALGRWFEQAKKDAFAFIESIPAEVMKLPSMLGQFIHGLLYEEVTNEKTGQTTEVPTALNNWLEQAKEDAIAFIGTIPERVRGIPSIIEAFVDSLTGRNTNKARLAKARAEITKSFTDQNGNIIDPVGLNRALTSAEKQIGKETEGFDLWGSVKEILLASGDALLDLGPDILDGLNTAFKWIGDQLTNFTKKMNDRDKSQGFLEWLGEQVFGEGESGESAIVQSISSLGETLKNVITQVLPSFIGAAFAELAVGVPKFISSIFGGGGKHVKAAGEEAGEELGASVAESMVDSFESALGDNLSESGGFDLSFLNPLNWFISSAGAEGAEDAADNMTESLKEVDAVLDKTKEQAQKETELVNRQEKIEELKKKAAKARNNAAYQESGIGADRKKRLQYLEEEDQLLDQIATLESMEEEMIDPKILEKTTNGNDAVVGFLSSFHDIMGTISSFANSNVVGVVATIAGLVYLVHALKDMLSITDEIEGIGYTAKMEAIKIAVLGIVAMLGWISYLSSAAAEDPSDQRLNKTMETLDKMVTFLERIGDIAKTLALIKGGTSVFNFLESIFDAKAAKAGGGDGGNWFTNIFGGLVKTLGQYGLVTVGSDALGESFESLFESLGATFSELGAGIDSFLQFLEPAINRMAELSVKMDSAISVVGKIADLIGAFYQMIGLIGISVAESDDETKAFMNAAELLDVDSPQSAVFLGEELQRRMTFMSNVSSMMINFAKSLKTFEEIKDADAQVERMLGVVKSPNFLEFIKYAINSIYNGLLTTFGGSMINLDSAAAGFDMLGNALSIFSDGISGLTVENVAAVGETLKVFEQIAEAFASVGEEDSALKKVIFGDNSLSKFGKEIKLFGGFIKSFFISIKGISGGSATEAKQIQTSVDLVVQIAQGLATAANQLATLGGVQNLDFFGSKLEGIGSNIGAFIRQVNANMGEDIDLKRVQIIAEGVKGFAELMKGLGSLGLSGLGPEEMPDLFNGFMRAIAENLATEGNDFYTVGLQAGANLDAGLAAGIGSGAAVAAAQALASAISGSFTVSWEMHSPSKLFEGFGKFLDQGLQQGIDDNSNGPIDAATMMAQESVDNVTSILDTIKDLAISDMDITPTITPVVDMSNVEAAAERIGLLGFNGIPFTFDTGSLNTTAQSANPTYNREPVVSQDYSNLIHSIIGQISNLGTQMAGSLSGFNGMQVVLDTGAIVGGIIGEVDSQLGRRGFYAGREG